MEQALTLLAGLCMHFLQKLRTVGIQLGRDGGCEESGGLFGDESIKVLFHSLLDAVGPLDHTRVGDELGDIRGMVRHKACDCCVLHGNLLPSKPGLDLEVYAADPFVDYHVMGSLDEALAVDDISFPVILQHGEVVEFDILHAGGPIIGGGVALSEKIPEGLQSAIDVVKVGLFSR